LNRFFFGKNKVMAIALGKSEEEEVLPNIHKLSGLLQGHCGLLFTNKKTEEVVE
jgi:mRNA turnover protein 4